MRSRIESLGVALPARRMTMEEVVAGCRVPMDLPLTAWTGIVAHQRGGKDTFAHDLARQAVEACLARSRVHPSEIGLIISCNISRVDAPGRFTYEPAAASRLAADFGLAGALAFDITNACAGMFTGLALAADFIATGRVTRALVLSGEYITHLSDTAQREMLSPDDTALSCLTLGDAGVAVLLDANDSGDGVGFDPIEILTLGTYCALCVSAPTYTAEGGNIMRTDSVRLGFVGTREGIRHMQMVLARWGESPADFDHVLLHQTSLATIQGSIRAGKKAWGDDAVDEHKFIVNLTERGNTASTTHWLAIWDGIQRGQIKSGERILLATVASGLVVGTTALRLDDLPDRLRAEPHPPPAAREAIPAVWITAGSSVGRVRFEAVGVADAAIEAEAVGLCRSAGEAAFGVSSYAQQDISHLIFIGNHRTGWIPEPATAAFVAQALKMNEAKVSLDRSTFAFDLAQGATGFLTGCEVARQLLAARPGRRVLLASAEMDPNSGTRADFSGWLATSGAAVVIDASPDPGRGLGGVLIRRFPDMVETLVSNLYFNLSKPYQTLTGRDEAIAFLVGQIPEAVAALLAHEGLGLDQVDLLLIPALLPNLRPRVAALLGLRPDRVFDPPEERQDRYTCSLPYLLESARRAGRGVDGDLGLLVELGAGLTVACALYNF